MGAEHSKESRIETFDEKRAEMMAVQEVAAIENNGIEKYLSQAMVDMSFISDEKVSERYTRITPRALNKFSEHFWQDKKNQLAMNAFINNDPALILPHREAAIQNQHVFNVKLELEGAATNQKQSGRCWIFAGKLVIKWIGLIVYVYLNINRYQCTPLGCHS